MRVLLPTLLFHNSLPSVLTHRRTMSPLSSLVRKMGSPRRERRWRARQGTGTPSPLLTLSVPRSTTEVQQRPEDTPPESSDASAAPARQPVRDPWLNLGNDALWTRLT